MSRGVTLNHTTVMVTEDCCQCGVLFAIPEDLRNRRLEDHKSFYCPNGHCMSFTGETNEQKAKKARAELEQVRKQLELARQGQRWTQDQLDAAVKERSALKGQLTKTRKRIANGVCPCCNRSFADLHRHMSSQHPDYVEVSPPPAVPS